MKNAVLGIIGCLVVLYTALLSLGIYSVYIRKNEMEKSLSAALYGVMNKYYMPSEYVSGKKEGNDSLARSDLLMDLETRLCDDADIKTTIYVCDMNKGIISAEIEQDFELPMGIEKHLCCTKTIVADRSVD